MYNQASNFMSLNQHLTKSMLECGGRKKWGLGMWDLGWWEEGKYCPSPIVIPVFVTQTYK